MDDDDYFPVYGQLGACHDMRDDDQDPPRLAGCRSVSPAAARALHRSPKPRPQRRIGFQLTRR